MSFVLYKWKIYVIYYISKSNTYYSNGYDYMNLISSSIRPILTKLVSHIVCVCYHLIYIWHMRISMYNVYVIYMGIDCTQEVNGTYSMRFQLLSWWYSFGFWVLNRIFENIFPIGFEPGRWTNVKKQRTIVTFGKRCNVLKTLYTYMHESLIGK